MESSLASAVKMMDFIGGRAWEERVGRARILGGRRSCGAFLDRHLTHTSNCPARHLLVDGHALEEARQERCPPDLLPLIFRFGTLP